MARRDISDGGSWQRGGRYPVRSCRCVVLVVSFLELEVFVLVAHVLIIAIYMCCTTEVYKDKHTSILLASLYLPTLNTITPHLVHLALFCSSTLRHY